MILKIVAAITLVSALLSVTAAEVLTRIFTYNGFLPWFFSLLVLFGAVLALAVFERRSPVFGSIFWKGTPGKNLIALTFDDGPNEPFTSQVIDILKQNQIKATFFVVGRNAERFPGSVRRLFDEGHELGNHTWTHEVLPLKTPARIREELTRTSELIEKAAGRAPVLFRAPHGWRNPWVNRTARECGLVPVAWSLGVWDTDRPGEETIVRRTLNGADYGCVLLLHDGRGLEQGADSSQLVRALPHIIEELKRRGFEFVTVSEMIHAERRLSGAELR